MNALLGGITWLFRSKKRTAALVAVLFAILHPLLAKISIQLDQSQVIMVVGVISAYLVGQGLSDVGKEAKLLEITQRKKR